MMLYSRHHYGGDGGVSFILENKCVCVRSPINVGASNTNICLHQYQLQSKFKNVIFGSVSELKHS